MISKKYFDLIYW